MKLAIKLPLAFAMALLTMCAAAFWGLYGLHQAVQVYASEVRSHSDNAHAVAVINAEFKTQV